MKALTKYAVLMLAALPATAEAHTGAGLHIHGLAAGLWHPFTGLDHILAMTAVGFWAANLGGRARYIVPLAFMAVMALGAGLGIAGFPLPMVETLIAASVTALGLLVAFDVKVATPVAATIVGICALFHGHAHGSELPLMTNASVYVLGFLAATAILHGVGIGFGMIRFSRMGNHLSRIAGGFITLAGVALLAG